MLNRSASLENSSDSTCVLKAEPGKLDIKRQEPGILFFSLQADSLFKLAIMTSPIYRFLCQFNVIDYVIQKVQRHYDLIKANAVRGKVYQVNVQQCS